jgi:hypothetical protein
VKDAKEGSKPEPKELEHGVRVIADRIFKTHSDAVHFKAGQNCGEAQQMDIEEYRKLMTKPSSWNVAWNCPY